MNILKYKNYMILLLLLILIGITTRVILLNTQNEDSNDIFLTDEEKAWLDDHKDQIKIGYTIDYPPVEFLENGQYAGISADYFNLLEKKLGIDIQMVQFDNFDELMNQALKRELTGITAATKTPQRSRYFEFTVPYIQPQCYNYSKKLF
jgi:ABC-type amino acid transport substrate-binding protein